MKCRYKAWKRVTGQVLLATVLFLPAAMESPARNVGKVDAAALRPEKSWFARHFRRYTWSEALTECNSPRDVCKMVDRHIGYHADRTDEWLPAGTTWQKGSGDCEDFAICVVEMCHELGFEAGIRLYFPHDRGQGHAVAVGKHQGQLWMSSLGSYQEVKSIEEVEKITAALLWCDADKLWTAQFAHADIARYLARD